MFPLSAIEFIRWEPFIDHPEIRTAARPAHHTASVLLSPLVRYPEQYPYPTGLHPIHRLVPARHSSFAADDVPSASTHIRLQRSDASRQCSTRHSHAAIEIDTPTSSRG